MPLRAGCALVVVATISLSLSRAAAAPCDADAAARADAIRAHLDREADRGHLWDLAWGTGFGVAAVAYGTMAATRWEFGLDVDDKVRDGMIIDGSKSAIAALSHLVLSFDVERAPAATGDACADLEAAQRALHATASHETQALVLNIIGDLALNGAGFLILGLHDHAWGEAGLSAGLGIPVGLVHLYTMPRASRRAVADGDFEGPPTTWTLEAVRSPSFTGLAVRATF